MEKLALTLRGSTAHGFQMQWKKKIIFCVGRKWSAVGFYWGPELLYRREYRQYSLNVYVLIYTHIQHSNKKNNFETLSSDFEKKPLCPFFVLFFFYPASVKTFVGLKMNEKQEKGH